MIIIHRPIFLADYLQKQRDKGLSIGFVPTMGALHSAHIDLVNHSARTCDITVCSIFINPTQFNDPSDYNKYPHTFEADTKKLAQSPATVLFAPPVNEVYPYGTSSLEHYDLGYLETLLEGEFRRGHFQGVCQVMSRLLTFVKPDSLFMGQKDYQQCLVIKRLLTLMQINTSLFTISTVREKDGLAMSSRNTRLTEGQRATAPLIFQTLLEIKSNLVPGDLNKLKHRATKRLNNAGFRVEYVEIAEAGNLHPYDEWDGTTPLVALVAAFLGEVRLIDNMLLNG